MAEERRFRDRQTPVRVGLTHSWTLEMTTYHLGLGEAGT